jgi:hypothetical protein
MDSNSSFHIGFDAVKLRVNLNYEKEVPLGKSYLLDASKTLSALVRDGKITAEEADDIRWSMRSGGYGDNHNVRVEKEVNELVAAFKEIIASIAHREHARFEAEMNKIADDLRNKDAAP